MLNLLLLAVQAEGTIISL